MMRLASDTTYGILKDFEDNNGTPFGGDIFPMVAEIKASYPFCVYQVDKSPSFSKDGLHDVTVRITIVDEQYENLCDLADALELHMDGYNHYIYESTQSGVNNEKPEELNISITYNLKMTK